MALVAGVLGFLALFAGDPYPWSHLHIDVNRLASDVEHERDHVRALDLARWIRERRGDLEVIDVRDAAAYDEYHVPSALHVDLKDLPQTRLGREKTIVLYSEGGIHAAQAWFVLRAMGYEHVYLLREGLYEWLRDVVYASIPEDATPAQREAFREISELSRYFGGTPRIGGPIAEDGDERLPVPGSTGRAGRTHPDLAESVRRRGC